MGWFASALPAQVMQDNLIPRKCSYRAGAGGRSPHIVVSIIKQTEEAERAAGDGEAN